MNRIAIIVVVLGVRIGVAPERHTSKSEEPAEQYKALIQQWQAASRALWTAGSDEEKNQLGARVDQLGPPLLELAEKNRDDPIVVDALIQVVLQEMWVESNTTYETDHRRSPGARAIAILLRDHIASEKLGDACRRMSYGFRRECETFLRAVLQDSPHHDIRALACLRLAENLKNRLHRLALLQEQPEMMRRYEGLFGREYLDELRRMDHAAVAAEAEALFERASAEYDDVKVPFGGTVGAKARSELFEMRHLSVGKEAPDIAGEDQNGEAFQLRDYRGKVVLLYFWSEF